jgi:hypothetical protein
MKPAEREKALRDACSTGKECEKETADFILDAAVGDPERKKLTALRKTLATTLAAKEKQRQAAEEARQRSTSPPAPPCGGRVRCCDGTCSPTCTTAHRGCCSHQGGVCA